jgi:hypothetical protein
MSKSVLSEQIWLGGDSSEGTIFAIALALIPHDTFRRISSITCGKLIYIHGECPKHKQVNAAARKSGKFVQEVFSVAEEDSIDH